MVIESAGVVASSTVNRADNWNVRSPYLWLPPVAFVVLLTSTVPP